MITLAVWGSRRPAPLEILRIDRTGAAHLLVGCAWPYGEHFEMIGTFGRVLDAAEHSELVELASALESCESAASPLGDIVAELTMTGGQHELRLSFPPPLVPTDIESFVEALSALARDLRRSPRGALEVHLEREPPRLELLHRGSEPFRFYGFEESDLGAAVEVHLGGQTDLADVPCLLHSPVEPLSNPPEARVDDAGLVELRPGEKLVLALPSASADGTALIRICYPRRDEEEGAWFPDQGWVVASAPAAHPRLECPR